MGPIHKPVLTFEILEYLKVAPGKKFIDATVGEGGHTVEIAKLGGRILGIDQDPAILEKAQSRIQIAGYEDQITLTQGNFRDIDKIANEYGFTNVDGILFDLGMSSWQLEISGRGFTFQKDEPLDMRMDSRLSVTAADLLNGLTRNELEKLLQKFGEEKRAFRIASLIARARSLKPFRTTHDLVGVVEKAIREKGRIHPATRVFQALRIAVNDEIDNLRSALPRAFEILSDGGRLAIVSFHSLEDREVKDFSVRMEKRRLGRILTEKPIFPSGEEVSQNPRSRSAKLRVLEKSA